MRMLQSETKVTKTSTAFKGLGGGLRMHRQDSHAYIHISHVPWVLNICSFVKKPSVFWFTRFFVKLSEVVKALNNNRAKALTLLPGPKHEHLIPP